MLKQEESKYALIIVMGDFFGGAERRLIRVYNEIAKRKKIDLYIRGSDNTKFRELIKIGNINVTNYNKIVCYRSNFINTIKCINNLMFRQYAKIHFFDYNRFNHFVSLFLKQSHTKVICTIANYNYHKENYNGICKSDLEKLIKNCDIIDLLYPRGVEYIKRLTGNKRIHITPGTFTDLDLFKSDKKENIILFAAARLENDKNPGMLVDACILFKDKLRLEKYEVWIVGQGGEEEALRNKIRKHKIEDFVKMKGYVCTSKIMTKAKVFLSLGLYENYPSQSLAEAAASGCYIIATDVGDTNRIIDTQCSKLIPCNVQELGNAMMDYIYTKDEIKELYQKQIRLFAEKIFDMKISVGYFSYLLDLS